MESVISWARAWCAAVPTREPTFFSSTMTFLGSNRPRFIFSFSTRVTDWSMRFSVSSPERTAPSTAL